MKRLFTLAVGVVAMALLVAPGTFAGVLGFTYTSNAGGAGCGVGTDNAYDLGGVTTELLYHIGGSGAMETNHGCNAGDCTTGGSLIGSGRADFPYSGKAVPNDDIGALAQRAAGTCANSTGSTNLNTTTDPGTAGQSFVHVSSFIMNDALSAAYTTATAATANDAAGGAIQSIIYDAYTLAGTANTTQFRGMDAKAAAHNVLHPVMATSFAVTTPGPPIEGAKSYHPHLVFDAGIIPGPATGPTSIVRTAGVVAYAGTAKKGVRIYRSTVDPTTTVAADFAPITFGEATANTAVNDPRHGAKVARTVNFDGTTNNAAYAGKAGIPSRQYFNDFTTDANATKNVNYIAVPVLVGDALNADGVPVLFVGSWGNPGQNSPGVGALPTPVSIHSFDATFDPKTGKVTLNWKTSAEDDLSGFNIWRGFELNGKSLGQRTFVAFVDAKNMANSSYTHVATLDASQYGKIAKGKPITVVYTLEGVNLDGSVAQSLTTSFTVSPKLSGTVTR